MLPSTYASSLPSLLASSRCRGSGQGQWLRSAEHLRFSAATLGAEAATPSGSPGETALRHRGTLAGDDNSFIKFRVVSKPDGTMRFVGLTIKRAVGTCGGKPDRIGIKLTGGFRFDSDHFFHVVGNRKQGGEMRIGGRFSHDSERFTGHVQVSPFDAGDGIKCEFPRKTISTKAVPDHALPG